MGKEEERTCVVHTVDSDLEGQIIEDLLQEAGVPAMISPNRDAAFDGYAESQKGWGSVIVLAEDRDEAEKIIEEYLASLEEEKARKKRKKKSTDEE
jgi:ABC-type Fe3+-hydroxamate transport system substrate-binding protein